MMPLDQLLLVSALTVLATAVTGRLKVAGWIATALYAGQLLVLVSMGSLGYAGGELSSALGITVLGQELGWRFDALSWYFALITIGAAFFASFYASGEWGEKFKSQGGNLWLLNLALALNVFAMLVLLASGDFLTLFIGWELVSWASFLMMALAGGEALRAALRYIVYAIGGAMAVLAGLALVYQAAGSLQYDAIAAAIADMSTARVVLLFLLFTAGFGVKMGLLPLHLWQARAYGLTPGPGTAFLGAISSRMGLYALVVVLIQLIGLARIGAIEVPFTFLDTRQLLAWVAALTIVLPTFTALRQNDARMLLAWHGIGQGGYMLVGLLVGDALGSAGGLMHVFNHATYQAALFFAVFAVVHRTGTADLNKLGGLV
ncbi:MAG: proton-conducting transporter membrane subunit, partial [Pseudomonadota bacterium]